MSRRQLNRNTMCLSCSPTQRKGSALYIEDFRHSRQSLIRRTYVVSLVLEIRVSRVIFMAEL
jgi:hypothetical protein